MPIPILASALQDGVEVIPGWEYIKNYGPIAVSVFLLKNYFAGSRNTWEMNFHGRVFIVTGGTSGLGASVVDELASKGAQLVLLVKNLHDEWVIDYVEGLREKHGNQLIYAEECDLNSLHSIRMFVSSWLNSRNPRRLDGVVLCAGESLPIGKPRQLSADGVEKQIAINYLANYHLLTLLAPAIRSQPSDRKVKILTTSCLSQVFGNVDLEDLLWEDRKYPSNTPWKVFGTSKLMLSCFVKEYQRRLDTYERSDKTSMSVRANIVNPGMMRSPSTKRFLSLGSIFGLMMYVLLYPILWIFLKSTYQGAQSFFYALSNPELNVRPGGSFIQECSVVQKKTKKELNDEEFQKKLYEETEKLINDIEKRSATRRNQSSTAANKKNKKKGKKQPAKKDEKEPEKPGISLMQTKGDALERELSKMDKTLPLFGDFSGNAPKSKENKYLKALDAKFEAQLASRNQAKTTSTEVTTEKPKSRKI
ncbi:putative oxidoreductase [Saccharomycopsis crataegensis]|uniref:Oxidoreductase n=1 Tax=Saccharomycopsis crataegensis TaxID=43959 RepID=A0AAV5QW78_9ASCO|nr:putative oxidoreductase [Saccharomycopsis crataegensis]